MRESLINEIYALRRVLQRNLTPEKYTEELALENKTPKSTTFLEFVGGSNEKKKTEKKVERKKVESKVSSKVRELLQVIGS
jgi:hypothetical protein